MTTHLFLGLDLGQLRDPSALAVIERSVTPTGRRDAVTFAPIVETELILRHVETFPLRRSWFDTVETLQRTLRLPAYQCPRRSLAVDATSVGGPVVEMMQKAKIGLPLLPIVITSGGTPHSDPLNRICIPRRDLLDNLALLFHAGKIALPAGLPHRPGLTRELVTLQYENQAAHDDHAVALALAAWLAQTYKPIGFSPNPLYLEY